MNKQNAIVAGTLLLLAACGGGGTSTQTANSNTTDDTETVVVETPTTEPVNDDGSIDEPVSVMPSDFGLSADVPPSSNFDLLGWYLNTAEADKDDGLSVRIDEQDLAAGYEDEYFYTADDGGMVFVVNNGGAKTSANTSYPRTELREMLRRGNESISTRGTENNWVFSSAPEFAQAAAGAVDGEMHASLAVNTVTTTGSDSRVGRVIVGQIHAEDDEPVRLYYRKLPNNTNGSIYAAHEVRNGEDIYYEILGSRSGSASNPADGIALDEIWSYEIKVVGNQMTVTIRSGNLEGEVLGVANIDMSASGYDIADEFMYFKAGNYNQNNTEDSGDPDDFSQVTFYDLKVYHD